MGREKDQVWHSQSMAAPSVVSRTRVGTAGEVPSFPSGKLLIVNKLTNSSNMLKISNLGVGFCKQSLRLYCSRTLISQEPRKFEPDLLQNIINNNLFLHRQLSLQSQVTIESIAKTQTGIFKTLSESTPVEYAQKLLLVTHDYTGLPWWASIVCTTVLLRTCVTLPLAVYQYYILAKLENLKLEMPKIVEELKKETAVAIKLYNWNENIAKATYNRSVRKQWNNLIIRDNCHPV
ncbi:hypothetical protein NQ317_019150 [Molorchus minor]|uniref:Uncharacterized protein n=1 Tax=Molorchus minor TaxID=1323400 RepID=A0ABQ9JNE8_9CUCU|nr:hypothetical protein NQ317_019150 [Molorchus minor]